MLSGSAVAVDGDTIAVSAPRDPGWGVASGSVYVYLVSDAEPQEICRDTTNTRVEGEGFECLVRGAASLQCDGLATSSTAKVDIRGTTPFGPWR